MGKLNCYNMAEQGVNVTKSPIHLDDGELTRAQNWQTDPALADGAIRRRDGMSKLNSSALAGSVKGLIALPLPSEFTTTRTFYAAIDDATTNSWRRSTDGATWATITTSTLRKAATTAHANGAGHTWEGVARGVVNWASFGQKIYFPGDDYTTSEDGGTTTGPTVYSWDGTTESKLFTVPTSPFADDNALAITSIIPYSSSDLIVAVADYNTAAADAHTRILLYDTVTGSLEQVGAGTNIVGNSFVPYVYQGRIWVAAVNFEIATTIAVMWARPGDSTFTSDANFEAAAVGGISMVEFLGSLYLGTHSSAATVARIRKRTAATAAWSNVVSTDGSGTGQYAGPLIVDSAGTTLLSYINYGNGTAPLIRIIKTTDGTTWSTDLDVVADLGAGFTVSGFPYTDSNGDIYWPLRKADNTGFIKKRTSAGTWSTVDTIANLRGTMQALKVLS